MNQLDISVILPVYNEVDNLVPLLGEIETALVGRGFSFEVIAVDDGSRDGSTKLLKDLVRTKPYLRVIIFRRNAGQAAAFDAGFRHVTGKYVVTMDADRQNDPGDIPRLIDKLNEGYDFVTGWRKKRKDGFFLRTFPSRIANWIIRKITKTQVHDLGCSLKAYRKEITDEIQLYGEMHRFLAVLVEGVGARVGEIESNHRARVAGESKYGISRTFKVLLDLLTVWFLMGYRSKPIYVFGATGGALMGAGAITALWVAWQKLATGIWVHKNPLFIISVMFTLLGVQFLGMGLIAEIIMRTYFESQAKSAYTVFEKLGFGGESAPTLASDPSSGPEVKPALRLVKES